eukprot:m51a1_g999 hypothetical protein (628) ;mRNA; f:559118-561238
MKFGEELRRMRREDWRFFYVDYDALKAFVLERTAPGSSGFSSGDESDFIRLLEAELTKACDFRDVKSGDLVRRVQALEDAARSGTPAPAPEVDAATQDLMDLSAFCAVNSRAVAKACKKHDRWTSFGLSQMFAARLAESSLALGTLDALVYRLSALYDALSGEARRGSGGDKGPREPSMSFTRRTSKYWVHPDDVAAIKCLVLRRLPVYVYDPSAGIDPAVSSVYVDNRAFELYAGRLQKTEGALAIRFRWYGSRQAQQHQQRGEVFVEVKTHREDWTGEQSVKERFAVKEKHVDELLQGTFDVDAYAEKLRRAGKSADDVDRAAKLARLVLETVASRSLEPTVRISLDTELCMIRERDRTEGSWRRTDEGSSAFPYSGVAPGDIERFPYAVLEVKLQTQAGQSPPQWVQDLVKGPLVEEVPKFSKFIHGTCALFPSEVPYWVPQMHVDIRKQKQRTKLFEETPAPSKKPDEYVTPTHGALDQFRQRRESTRNGSTSSAARMEGGGGSGASRGPQGPEKRIAVPVRVEPKVFFANERTFLSWLHYSVFLGSSASALLGLGGSRARTSGIVIAGTSLLVAVYALVRYQIRASQIRRRDPGPYDDRVGPVLLVLVVIAVAVVSIVMSVV